MVPQVRVVARVVVDEGEAGEGGGPRGALAEQTRVRDPEDEEVRRSKATVLQLRLLSHQAEMLHDSPSLLWRTRCGITQLVTAYL